MADKIEEYDGDTKDKKTRQHRTKLQNENFDAQR